MTTNVWRGNAVDIRQVDIATVSGTWATADEAYLEINGNRLVVTLGTSTTVANVAQIMANAINATGKTDSLQGDEIRNFGGQELPELTEIGASNTATEIVLEGLTAGKPFSVTIPAPSSASGNIVLANSVSCTGRNFFDNADNWSLGAAPTFGDQIVFQDSSVDCLYGLNQHSVTNATMQIDASYTGRIGLAPRNSTGYDEYRRRHLGIKFSSAARGLVIGEGPGNGSARINIDPSDTAVECVIDFTASPESGSKAAVDFIGGAGATIGVRQGTLSLAATSSNDASVATLEMTYNTQITLDAQVYVGTKARIGEIKKSGGQLTFVNTDGGTISTCTNQEGIIEFNGAMGVTLLDIQGGQVIWNSSGTLATCQLSGSGIIDFSRDNAAKTVTNPIERYSDASQVADPYKVVTGLVIDNNQVTNMSNLKIGNNFRITRAATA